MKEPNFFILGAPKCGTTSMDMYLASHPSIFMAKKEPHYFNTDHKNRKIKNLTDYQALFAGATDTHLAIGEASVRYLYSEDAVANILNYNPDAKFIVMLRNPIDMAYSWHNQLYSNTMENQRDFKNAWQLQNKRKCGEQIPLKCREVKMLYYGKVCSLGEQLQRLYTQVPAERVHLIFFDDLAQNPRQVYQNVLRFLAVPEDNKQDFVIYNPAKTYRLDFLKDSLPKVLSQLGSIKIKLGIKHSFGLLERMRFKNIKTQQRVPLSPKIRQTLINYFCDDIALLSQITGRNLDSWIK